MFGYQFPFMTHPPKLPKCLDGVGMNATPLHVKYHRNISPLEKEKTHESCIHACLFRNHSFSRPWFGWLAMDHSVDVRRGGSPVVWIFRDSDSFEGGIYVPFYASFLCEDVEYLLWVCLSERMNEREVRTWDWGCCWQMEGQDVWMRIWGCQLM